MVNKLLSVKVLLLVVIAGMICAAINEWSPQQNWGYYNGTASAPKGFYRIINDQTELSIDQYVIIPVPENVREFVYGRGWSKVETRLLKRVGALPGDVVTINDEGIFVNECYKGRVLKTDKEGLPLPQIRGTFVIQPGEFLPLSPYNRSFDGRYFGPVSQSSIQHRVNPLLTY